MSSAKISANELRIGSKLQFVVERRRNPINRVVEVCSIQKNQVVVKDMGFDVSFSTGDESLQPIPLSPSILEKAGFDGWNDNGDTVLSIDAWGGKDSARWDIDYREGLIYVKSRYEVQNLPAQALRHITSLHQLQNLYLALCGKELEINL